MMWSIMIIVKNNDVNAHTDDADYYYNDHDGTDKDGRKLT